MVRDMIKSFERLSLSDCRKQRDNTAGGQSWEVLDVEEGRPTGVLRQGIRLNPGVSASRCGLNSETSLFSPNLLPDQILEDG